MKAIKATDLPKLPEAQAPAPWRNDGYPENWGDIAYEIKTWAGWKCENCRHSHQVETGHVLTVHHLNGIKDDCRFENLLAACQRCHLSIQSKYQPGQAWLLGKPEWAIVRGL